MFMESLWHKKTDCTSLAKKFFQIICMKPVKRNFPIFFCKHLLQTGFCKRTFNFCKFANFFVDSKREHKSFPMMYNFSYIKYTSRERVNSRILLQQSGLQMYNTANYKLFQTSMTTLKLSTNLHISWDTLYLSLEEFFYLSGLHQTNNYLSQEGSKSWIFLSSRKICPSWGSYNLKNKIKGVI